MKRIRVAFVELPGLLSDILKEIIRKQDEMVFVGTYEEAELKSATNEVPCDVLIWAVDETGMLSSTNEKVLRENPGLAIISLSELGRTGILWKLKFDSTPLGEIIPRNIVSAIKGLVAAS